MWRASRRVRRESQLAAASGPLFPARRRPFLAPPDASGPRRAKRVASRREQSATATAYGTRAVPVSCSRPGERLRSGATTARLSAWRRQPRARRVDPGADSALARGDGSRADWLRHRLDCWRARRHAGLGAHPAANHRRLGPLALLIGASLYSPSHTVRNGRHGSPLARGSAARLDGARPTRQCGRAALSSLFRSPYDSIRLVSPRRSRWWTGSPWWDAQSRCWLRLRRSS